MVPNWYPTRTQDDSGAIEFHDGARSFTGGVEFKLLNEEWKIRGRPEYIANFDLDAALHKYRTEGPVDRWNAKTPHRFLPPLDDQIVTNEQGGRQHAIPYRFDALDPYALLELAKLRAYAIETLGYEKDNWKLITKEEHFNHAMSHLWLDQAGDTSEDHLIHALCRVMFMIGVRS